MIQKIISGRKKRLVLKPGIYCGQTTPMVRMSVIVSRRTRVNQSSHSRVAKLLSIAGPRLHAGIRASPKSRQELRKTGIVPRLPENGRCQADGGPDQCIELSLPMSENSGKYIEMTTPPTTTPKNTIMMGSRAVSKSFTAASTSSS